MLELNKDVFLKKEEMKITKSNNSFASKLHFEKCYGKSYFYCKLKIAELIGKDSTL